MYGSSNGKVTVKQVTASDDQEAFQRGAGRLFTEVTHNVGQM